MNDVVVLLSTYNGEKFIREQLDSILAQEDVDVQLFVRDDGSTDRTIDILTEYAKQGKLKWYSGKNLRSSKSFMDLIFSSPETDFYALCDQDDFWLPGKLSRAIKKLLELDPEKPQLYFSATNLVDSNLKPLKNQFYYQGVLCFAEAVVSSNATGCTMCFNKKLRDLIRKHRPVCEMMHDGWIHKLCLAVGGEVVYDPESFILYRQHGNNVVGGNSSFFKRWKRRITNLRNLKKTRSSGIIEIYKFYRNQIKPENLEICKIVNEYDKSFIGRVQLAFCRKVYSKRRSLDFFFRMAVLIGIF